MTPLGRVRQRWLLRVAGLAPLPLLVATGLLVPASTFGADPPPLRALRDPNPSLSGIWVDTVNDEIAVSDDSRHSVLFYPRTASGPTAPLRQIRGNSTLIDLPTSVVVDPVNNEVWSAMNDSSERAVVHSRTANGNAPPLRVISFAPPGERGSNRSWGWAVDPVNDEVIAMFQRNPGAIAVFDRVSGELKRRIRGERTGLADPKGLSVDLVNDEIFGTSGGLRYDVGPAAPSITVYSRTASGNVAPLRRVQGPRTGLSLPQHIHVDAANNEMAIANGGAHSISVFARDADGDAAPLRTIAGALTGLKDPTGVFIDAVHDEILVTSWGNHTIRVYPRTADGDVAPLRVIAAGGGPQLGIGNPGSMAIDLVNDEFAVTNCVSHPRIAIFDRLADGQVAPKRVIYGPDTRIGRSAHGVWIDSVNDEIAYANEPENSILIFDRLADGNVPPKRVVQGPNTGIQRANAGVFVDSVNDELLLLSGRDRVTGHQKVTIWDRLADGDTPPKREFSNELLGGNTIGIWVDTTNDEIYLGAEGIFVFDRLATGDVQPKRWIQIASVVRSVEQIALDLEHDEVVGVYSADRDVDPPVYGGIVVFDRLADGLVEPKRYIQHVEHSFVLHPRAMWLDPIHGEIGVGDSKTNEILVFPLFWEEPDAR